MIFSLISSLVFDIIYKYIFVRRCFVQIEQATTERRNARRELSNGFLRRFFALYAQLLHVYVLERDRRTFVVHAVSVLCRSIRRTLARVSPRFLVALCPFHQFNQPRSINRSIRLRFCCARSLLAFAISVRNDFCVVSLRFAS